MPRPRTGGTTTRCASALPDAQGRTNPQPHRLALQERDEIREVLVRGEVVTEILDAWRRAIGIRRGAYGDHGLEIGVGFGSNDREP